MLQLMKNVMPNSKKCRGCHHSRKRIGELGYRYKIEGGGPLGNL